MHHTNGNLSMKTASKSIALSLLLASLAFTQTACNQEGQSKDKPKTDSLVTIPVEVATVSVGDVSAYYTATATLQAEFEAQVVANLGGLVNEIYVEEGDKVKAGQLLAKLDDRQYKLEVDRADASLRKLENDYKRNKELFDKGLISSETYDNARFQYEQQKASLELAKLNFTFTKIIAPIDGVISERLVKLGNMISPNAGMFKITDFDPLHAIIFVPEHELRKIKVGQKTDLKVDSYPDQVFTGKVLRINPTVDAQTGTFKVTVEIKDASERLKPGMFARVMIEHDTHKGTLLVSKQAITIEDGNESVYVIRGGQSFKMPVTTGFANGTKIELAIAKLAVGDTVVTIGQNSLKDSARVQIISMR